VLVRLAVTRQPLEEAAQLKANRTLPPLPDGDPCKLTPVLPLLPPPETDGVMLTARPLGSTATHCEAVAQATAVGPLPTSAWSYAGVDPAGEAGSTVTDVRKAGPESFGLPAPTSVHWATDGHDTAA
jgi:hypothetical protein